MRRIITFPENFIWGAASASYQTEGGNERSALAGDWERRKRWEPCANACGSWGRFGEDLKCLQTLGAKAYRFSVEWSRLEPEPGVFDDEALRRYEDWCRQLHASGIEPVVTLHHFSEPAWLLRAHPRGWPDPGVRERWLELVERVGQALTPHVSWWTTINEPMVFALSAYAAGVFPPGSQRLFGLQKFLDEQVVPALARAHNEAYVLLKKRRPEIRISIAHHVNELLPARSGDESAVERWDRFFHRAFLDLVKGRLDYLGLNYYTRAFVAEPRVPFLPFGALPGNAEVERGIGPRLFRLLGGVRGDRPRTDMGWEVAPDGFGRVLSRFWNDYRLPILVTENGMADAGGDRREDFLRTHLTAIKGAMDGGARVLGYLHWSLTDNWEWGSYVPRFGLFDRERRPAGGCDFYARVCRTGGFA